jgi:hypothetical protein
MSRCRARGFVRFVVHSPLGAAGTPPPQELVLYRHMLGALCGLGGVEVEEILASSDASAPTRPYGGPWFERLLAGQAATPLLDTYEEGGVDPCIRRLRALDSKGFAVETIHLHKNKHEFVDAREYALLRGSGYDGAVVNEGFVREESSFDAFLATGSAECIVPNEKRITILESYVEVDRAADLAPESLGGPP